MTIAIAIALALFSVVIALLSLYGVFQPSRLATLVSGFMAGGSGLWVAVAVRLVLAALLWFSAPLSLTPIAFRVLALIALAATFVLPLAGAQRILKLMSWFENQRPLVISLWCLLGVAFGGFIFWSISPVFGAV